MSALRKNVIAPVLMTIAGIAVGIGPAAGQASSPCDRPEMRQFDFWIGEWDCHGQYTDSLGEVQRYTLSNAIVSTLDGCVIQERFDGTPFTPLKGISLSTFDSTDSLWKQTWVDNSGAYLDFAGSFSGGIMTLGRSFVRNDSTIHQRMRWTEITDSSFVWLWEKSTDGGATFEVAWRLDYARKK